LPMQAPAKAFTASLVGRLLLCVCIPADIAR
jgi:hypothetical protein